MFKKGKKGYIILKKYVLSVLIRLNMVFFHSLIHIGHLSVTDKSMHTLSSNKLQLQQTTIFATFFPIFDKNKV